MADKLAVLASGSGTNLQALLDADLGAPISVVITNRPGAKALDRARAAGVPTRTIDHKGFDRREAFDEALVAELRAFDISWVVLAGFMRILSPVMLRAFPRRIVNIHPSLLPAFPGIHAQRQALEAGVRITGCTVHLVDEGVDTGPILAQVAVPVLPQDDEAALTERVLVREHQILPAVVRALLRGQLVEADRVYIEGDLELGAAPGTALFCPAGPAPRG